MRDSRSTPLWRIAPALALLIGLSGATTTAAAPTCTTAAVRSTQPLRSDPTVPSAPTPDAWREARICTSHANFSAAPRTKMCVATMSCAESTL